MVLTCEFCQVTDTPEYTPTTVRCNHCGSNQTSLRAIVYLNNIKSDLHSIDRLKRNNDLLSYLKLRTNT